MTNTALVLPRTDPRDLGYARVSTKEQTVQPQIEALVSAGVAERDIFSDIGWSGTKSSRPQFDELLHGERGLRRGDTLNVWRLDRLGRNTMNVLLLGHELVNEREIHLRALANGINTREPGGMVLLHLFALVAELERMFISDRTKEAAESKRRAGANVGGRPSALSEGAVKIAQQAYDSGMPKREIAAMLHVSPATIYRVLSKGNPGSILESDPDELKHRAQVAIAEANDPAVAATFGGMLAELEG